MSTSKFPNYIVLESNIPYDWDDYDLFGAVYYDIQNEKIITTKYGHGEGDDIESMSLKEALNNNIITCDKLISVMIKSLGYKQYKVDAIKNLAYSHSLENPIGVKVNVNRGRKFKGEGYLVYCIREHVRYGLGAYKNEYNYYPMILNPVDGSINKVNSFSYLEFPENICTFDNLMSNLNISEKTVYSLAHLWAYNMSYSHCDTEQYYYELERLANKALGNYEPNEEVQLLINKEIERIKAEKEAKMNADLPNIIEWVKKNTDKTEETDILELAKHIWYKHND